MIMLDEPYVSGFLKETIKENHIPVLKNTFAITELKEDYPFFISGKDAAQHLTLENYPHVLCPSENSLEWLHKTAPHSPLAINSLLFKDKVQFRKHTESLYPDLFYREISLSELRNASSSLSYPCVVKPAVGFFSLSVYTLFSEDDTREMLIDIEKKHQSIEHIYPKSVLDTTRFIAEEYIQGTEYAFDAYFDVDGNPVVMGIFQHYFASDADVSDRLYITSADIMQEHLSSFTSFLSSINKKLNLRNFPLHTEVRIDAHGSIVPIEINPLRFGGWCTTADLTWHAYGYNPYLGFFKNEAPQWSKILNEHNKFIHGLVVLNNSTGVEGSHISSFNYQKLLHDYTSIIELRRTDYKKFPLFGFLFVKIKNDDIRTLEPLLNSSLLEYI